MSKQEQQLQKSERLTHSKPIQLLFEKGEEFYVFPFKIVWQKIDRCDFPAKAMFVVPKRRFKLAVTRNFIRRVMKEAYRLNKQVLYGNLLNKDASVYIAFIYLGPETNSVAGLQKPMLKVFKNISETFTIANEI